MAIEFQIQKTAQTAIKALYSADVEEKQLQVQLTRKDQKGDYTLVVFPLLRFSKKSAEETASEIGDFLKNELSEIASFEVIKGFLNLTLSTEYWLAQLNIYNSDSDYGFKKAEKNSPLMMIEYSSPNTNKPLHLGHIRNNLLGYSLSRIAEANGFNVVKTNIVNDRGIHICKSMLAWQKWGDGETPQSSGIKGDHLVGKYYVKFDQEYKAEVAKLVETGISEEEAEKSSQLMIETRQMLLDWENGKEDVVKLWETMNQWVYDGFDVTYDKLGVDFDKIYYESDTYTVGRDMVLKGLEDGVFYRREDGSVWADLTEDGLDEKILLRSDGTSVYMTQDVGTAKLRFDDYPIDEMIYVVGNEQDYHFKVLSFVLDKLNFSWGKDLFHFSYGMVELPDGKMKSREGTVVDADDLIDDMVNTAREMSKELGKLDGYTDKEAEDVYEMIALGALKYFMLKVDPKRNMTFNPAESIDFNGNTGPFIQYTHARIKSIFRKADKDGIEYNSTSSLNATISEKELSIIKTLGNFKNIVADAGENYSPAIVANYVYDLAKEFNQFYHDSPILFEDDEELRNMRLAICHSTATTIKKSMWLLGVDVPEKM